MSKDVKKVLTSIDRSTKQLDVAGGTLQKTVEVVQKELGELTKQLVETATDIEFKQSELDALTEQYAVKEREAKAELVLKIKENETSVLDKLLKDNGLAKVTNSEFKSVNDELANIKESFDSRVEVVREEAFNQIKTEFNAKVSQIDSAHRVEVAELKAKSGADQFKIEQLEDMVKNLRENLEAERETRVKIAQADAGKQGVIVNTSK